MRRKLIVILSTVLITTAAMAAPADARRARRVLPLPGYLVGVYAAASAESGVPYSTLVRISSCESGHNPNARNRRSSARGLFQQLGRYWPGRVKAFNAAHPDSPLLSTSIFDPVSNTRVSAAMMSRRRGLRAWSCK